MRGSGRRRKHDAAEEVGGQLFLSFGLLESLLPIGGSELEQSIDGPGSDQAEQVPEIAVGFDAVEACACELDDAFSPVREYILGTEVQDGPTVGEDGEPAILIDQRYVEPWFGRSSRPPVTSTGVHAIELVARGGGIGALIGLFGGSEWFAVRLGPTTGLDSRRLGTRLVRRDEDDYWYLHGVWVSWKKMRGRGLSPADVLSRLQLEPTT
jgi:hypothetical protein